MKHLRN